eukprot:TRINITY_DN2240_c0_g2_i1.p1 TRINITY_DN2240_c0_g2~~TRINITY_DN2240_c0_g2_i1.p1  ORF type:complete len:702 (+),score=189.20 TRINITY_DN2240_c0_g2_i1:157-2262(+)
MASIHQLARAGDKQGVASALGGGSATVNDEDASGNRALHLAAGAGHADVVALLLGYSPSVDAQNAEGNTALHEAAKGGHVDIVVILISNSAEVNQKNNNSMTPLHYAVLGGHAKVILKLVDQGAHINTTNTKGQTPLHVAASEGNIDMVAFLLDKGAPANVRDSQGSTALASIPLADRILPPLPSSPAASSSSSTHSFMADIKSITFTSDAKQAEEYYTDVVFTVDTQKIHAHRNIVASRCPKLRKMFRGGAAPEEVEIKDTTFNAFQGALEFIYSDDVDNVRREDPDLRSVLSLLLAADRYQLVQLRTLCEAVITRNLSTASLAEVWSSTRANKTVAPLLYQSACQLVAANWDTVATFKGVGADMNKDELVDMVRQLAGVVRKPVKVESKPLPPAPAPTPKHSAPAKPAPSPSAHTAVAPESGVRLLMEGSKNLKQAKEIVRQMFAKKTQAWPFLVPVDPVALGIPDYPLIITNPMDLGTIDNRLKNAYYHEVEEFASDVRLVFDNACTYNLPGSDIVNYANQLRHLFEQRYNTFKWEVSPGKVSEYSFPSPSVSKKPPPKKPAPSPSQFAAPTVPSPHVKAEHRAHRTDEHAVEMTFDEKKLLGEKMNQLTADQLARVVAIISENRPSGVAGNDEDIEIDMNDLDAGTLRKLEGFVDSCLPEGKKKSKKHRGQDDDVVIDDDDKKHKKKHKHNGNHPDE